MAAREYRWRHLVLLILLLVLYIAAPFVLSLPFGTVILNIVASAVFVAGVYAVSERKRWFVVTVIVAICSVSLSWLQLAFERPAIVLAAQTSLALMLSLFAVGILVYVLRSGRVTADKIYAAICVYLLIGYAWSFVYSVVEQLYPGSFSASNEPIASYAFGARSLQMRYFSFLTLTTVGYGDIIPRSPAARTFAVIEAIMGQMYLAVLVARLVGLHIVHTIDRPSHD
jgi:voltage-gated potassium channel